MKQEKFIRPTIIGEFNLKKLPLNFHWQESPFQIYPLSFITELLNIPKLSLFHTNYNFIIYLKTGSIERQIGSNRIEINAPAILAVLNELRTDVKVLKEGLEGYFILFENRILTQFFNDEQALDLYTLTLTPVLKLNEDDSYWINKLNELLYIEIQKSAANWKILSGLIQSLLFKILQLPGNYIYLTRNQQIAIHFTQLIHLHYIKEKTTSFYANCLNISDNYLNRCVRNTFKRSAKEIIIEIIIQKSLLLLWDLSKDVSEISYELNYKDPSYFSRIFKKMIGLSPSEYRIHFMHD